MEKGNDGSHYWDDDIDTYTDKEDNPSFSYVLFWGCVFTIIALLFNLLIGP